MRRIAFILTVLSVLLVVSLGLCWPVAAEERPAPDITKDKILYTVTCSHLDTQWLWTIQKTINEFLPNTLHQNFALFEKFPNYKLSFEGAYRYQLMKEYYPEDYARLKEYVAKDRWCVVGSSVDAGDTNMPSPESIIRHVLYGNGFFKREFGKRSYDIFLPDCFGFGYALPSVAAHCGLKGFSTQKLTWGSAVGIPFDIGIWEGPDGSSIVAALNPGGYTEEIKSDLSDSATWLESIYRTGNKSRAYVAYKYFGVGDQGGGPTAETVSWLEKSIAGNGPIRVLSVASDKLYQDLTADQIARLPRYKGELVMTAHGVGSYSSQAAMKRWNRKNELLADAAERASVAAEWLGGARYPRQKLTDAWMRFLWLQFHDILTGTSIPKAYTFAWNDEAVAQNQLSAVLNDAVGAVTRALDTSASGVPIVVYNPLSIDREDVVEATVRFARGAPGSVRVYDPAGNEVPSQVGERRAETLKVVFLAQVPSVGFKVFDVRPSAPSSLHTGLKATTTSLENSRYVVRLNNDGDVESIRDKAAGRELLSGLARLELLFDDPGPAWPAWEIAYDTVAAKPRAYVDGPAKPRVVEKGPARIALEINRQKDGSTFTQQIRLAAGKAADRVEFQTFIDWKTKETLVKASFPLANPNEKATYDLGLGTIERGSNTKQEYEVPAQRWADVAATDGSYGVAVLNDSKYGWDKPNEGTLRLTLVRTPKAYENFAFQGKNDLGQHRILYAVAGHKGDWHDGGVVGEAARLNQPLLAFQAVPHKGKLGKSFSLFSVSSPQVAAVALKKAENSDEIVVRLQETNGRPASGVRVSAAVPISEAREVNGAEEPLGAAQVEGGTLIADLGAYQPKAFALKLADAPASVTLPTSKPVALEFDLDVASLDSDRKDGDFDGQGNSLAGELLPDTLNSEGIEFKLGLTSDGAKNAVACKGQKINLEAGNYRSLYLLAAASGGDQTALFKLDGKPVTIQVQDFSGFIGQWDRGGKPAYSKPDSVAWLGTHRHTREGANEAYAFSYLFKYRIDLPTVARQLTLPKNEKVKILAATLADNPNELVVAYQAD